MNPNYPKPGKPHIRIRLRTAKAYVYYNTATISPDKLRRNLDCLWGWLGTLGFCYAQTFESYTHQPGVVISTFHIHAGTTARQALLAKLKSYQGAN